MPGLPELWLRAESKAGEARTPLVPGDAALLVEAGFRITVERSPGRCIPDQAYRDAGCQLVSTGSWNTAPADALVLGLKELPDKGSAISHRHIYFAHAYKEQAGWQSLLGRFGAGGGTLLDLEYLVDDSGRRLAAFGYWAGFVGAALGLLAWCARQQGREPVLPPLSPWVDRDALLADCRQGLVGSGNTPSVMVMGALGRVGTGARDLATRLGLTVTGWDLAETRDGGPFAELLAHDIFVNCVLVSQPMPPFVTPGMLLAADRRLEVIADVSCDPYGSYNPLPLYSECTSTEAPTLRLGPDEKPVDLIAIDNLPSLLPRESSEDFSAQLLPALEALRDNEHPVWRRAEDLFRQHLDKLG